MWQWWKSLFRAKPNYDTYKPSERVIYTYWNGQNNVTEDPIIVYRRLMDVGPELSVDMKVSTSIHKDAGIAYVAMVKKIRGIFDLKPMSEGGLTEAETVQLLDHFLTFCGMVKKNSSPTPTNATATSPSSPSSWVGNPPTANTSASGSTANEPTTDAPPKSAPESK